MIVKKYKSVITNIYNPIAGIYTFEFISLGGKFRYHPGQFLHLAIDSGYDGTEQWPDSRCFSIQSNPEEPNIKITYSVKGKFTKQMEEKLAVGSEVWLKLPYGDLFTQPHDKDNTVFIAGGTGITPFLSLFSHESFKQYSSPAIYLGFQSKDHNIYSRELDSVKKCDIIFYYENENGPLDINRIFVDNGVNSTYFISGPPSMIKIFKCALVDEGIPVSKILTDEWE